VFVTGFPVRGECQKKYSPEQVLLLKMKHGLLDNHLSLTLVLGAAGNRMLMQYAQELSKLSNEDFPAPIEINICVGRNEKIRGMILAWLLQEGGAIKKETAAYTTVVAKNGLVFHLRKFTKELVEIMVCSTLVITKTGSCSVNEAIYLGKKLLLDNTEKSSARYLFWETFNVPFVRKHGLGDAFYHISELNCMIRVLLKEDLGHPVLSCHFSVPDFKENVLQVISKLFSSD
jgi:UDP-N-acetylglucosamine:LPS N-acetylglucosamine transferase